MSFSNIQDFLRVKQIFLSIFYGYDNIVKYLKNNYFSNTKMLLVYNYRQKWKNDNITE